MDVSPLAHTTQGVHTTVIRQAGIHFECQASLDSVLEVVRNVGERLIKSRSFVARSLRMGAGDALFDRVLHAATYTSEEWREKK